ncbi:hypothetical protein RFI_24058 [Reticulomyxa filosa]|uniref:Uncharacterized protein n=1 Tax=Reticulomyxa filosa TaxID=46433 RepID=X6MI38_RETFI|nr:hypothetical protein RFI_24058 [Reticulomyxa filosa]|eukprot:ETO13316.1 hypothetical protein RFI_24058 [Reticulomyxa filosa]
MYSSKKTSEPRLPTLRILVLGDSGVGKTSVCRRICQIGEGSGKGEPNNQSTIGADFHVLLHAYNRTTNYFIEFIDCSGSADYKISRPIYYRKVDGILLVFDTYNKRSYENLHTWLRDFSNNSDVLPSEKLALGTFQTKGGKSSKPSYFHKYVKWIIPNLKVVVENRDNDKSNKDLYDMKECDEDTPVFIIGNKIDKCEHKNKERLLNIVQTFDTSKDFGHSSIFVSTCDDKYTFSEFFHWLNTIIAKLEHKCHHTETPTSSANNNNGKIESRTNTVVKNRQHYPYNDMLYATYLNTEDKYTLF